MFHREKINLTLNKNYNYFYKFLSTFKNPKIKWNSQRNYKGFCNTNNLYMFSTKSFFLFVFFKIYFKYKLNVLSDIYAIDYISNKYRFHINYNLISKSFNRRIFLKFFIKIFESMFSLWNLFKSSIWLEREIWDMFGVFFIGNLDLRRILTDYAFIGFPLRKNFPLLGFFELRFDFFKKSVILSNIELTQEFRKFNNDLNWL